MPLIRRAGARGGRGGVKVRWLDALIVALSAALFVCLAVSVYGGPPSSVLVITSGGDEWIYQLSQDRVIEVPGLIGVSIVGIHDGEAHIDDSPCANRTCVASQPIRRPGEWAACLPNGVFIRIEGEEIQDEFDAFVR
ncbi:MAG TPA: NusG domain II-containing protein [Spirochaetales bacterium]|nr:NusG domain II-containing protein [Spirochaetales bacterium]